MSADRPDRPIGDYAAIGNGRTVALVASDGSVDWLCIPEIDSGAAFCRILDRDRGGFFATGPVGPSTASRRYVGRTNVLATTFRTSNGSVRVTDFMPAPDADEPNLLLRLVEGLSGSVTMTVDFEPAFDFAGGPTTVERTDHGAVATGAGHEPLHLWAPATLELRPGRASGTFTVGEGDRRWLVIGWGPAAVAAPADPDAVLEATLRYWEAWSDHCTYEGPYHDLVRRSALALKLMAYQPTGAVVAAPTTSLPEDVGGVRNWDYRYTWLRDSSLMLYALQSIGYHEEADAFFGWLERLCLRCRDRLQIMYRVDGGEELPERTLDHLSGWRGSRPVRVGNAAVDQTQLDVYGELLDAAHMHLDAMPGRFHADTWSVLSLLADRAADRWREPDDGIWEVRGGQRHFLYSKLLCWVALDRALRIADDHGAEGDLDRWAAERDAIRQAILDEGWNEELGAFTQAFGEATLDASTLAISTVGFLPATDPRVRSTVAAIRERLTHDGLVYRYLPEDSADGLPGGEATFAMCSFWLVDHLALAGDVDEARALFEQIVSYANDVGLLAEEIDPASGELLGNFPQGFTHLALIRSALAIAEAEANGPQQEPETYAERRRRTPGTPDPRGASHAQSTR